MNLKLFIAMAGALFVTACQQTNFWYGAISTLQVIRSQVERMSKLTK